MTPNEYLAELTDVETRLRDDIHEAIDRYNLWVDHFYYRVIDDLIKVNNDFNIAIFDADSAKDYIAETFDSPDAIADRLNDEEYAAAVSGWQRLNQLADAIDQVHAYIEKLKREVEHLNVAYIDKYV